ncbi:PASTA domain-containing protein, partial [Streptomyces sp. NPDC059233]
GSAVFPPLDSGFQAPPQSVQQPYQAPQTASPYGPPTPAPQPQTQGGYAYPHTPPPQQYAAPTPPPYTISPSQSQSGAGAGSGGGKRNMPVVVGAIAVAMLAIGGLIAVIVSNGDDDKKDAKNVASQGTSSAPSTVPSAKASTKGPDPSRTIDPKLCKEPVKSFSDAGKYSAPDLRYKDLRSVKECIQASGGKYEVVYKDEAVYGKDQVLEQNPRPGDKIDKEGTQYTLT